MKIIAKPFLLGTALLAAVVGAGLTIGATRAEAVPSGCSSSLSGKTTTARCTSGTGEVRAVIECYVTPPGRDPVYSTIHGPWVGVGASSSASCGGGSRVYEYWHELR